MFKGDHSHVCWFYQKFNWFFHGHCFREVFQTLHDYNLVRGLATYIMCDDLDFVLRSQMCQNHKLQFKKKKLFLFTHCSLNVMYGCYTLKISSMIGFVWLCCEFKGRNTFFQFCIWMQDHLSICLLGSSLAGCFFVSPEKCRSV